MDITRLAPIPQIELPSTEELIARFSEFDYDREGDTLYLYLGSNRPGIYHYLDQGVYVKFDPETHEVFGLMIERYETRFLPTHPELAKVWREGRRVWFIPKRKTPQWMPTLSESLRPVLRPGWGV